MKAADAAARCDGEEDEGADEGAEEKAEEAVETQSKFLALLKSKPFIGVHDLNLAKVGDMFAVEDTDDGGSDADWRCSILQRQGKDQARW